MDIYMVRHGHLEKDDVKRYVGQTDYPLSSLGEAQADALRLALSGVKFSKIVASDLKRTMQTALKIARNQDATVEAEPALREISLGRWEGMSFDEVKTRYPEEYQARGADLAEYRPPEGESFDDLSRRVVPAIKSLASDENDPLLIVAHLGVIRVFLCHVLDIPLKKLDRLAHDYGAFTRLSREGDEFRLVCFNCTAL